MAIRARARRQQKPSPKLEVQLKQIEEVSRNARGTWLSLMAVLLFSAIAVAGVKDRDFFVYGAGLSLPVINFTVPVKSFFYAGPVIVLGLYTYLHLYLLKLWRALAVPMAKLPDGRWLDEAVFPWLISDAAISVKENAPKRRFDWLTKLVAILFLWAAGPLILLFFWWRSFPPHDLLLTSWTGSLASLSLIGAVVSFNACGRMLRPGNGGRSRLASDLAGFSLAVAFAAGVGLLATGYLRTIGTFEYEWVFFRTPEDAKDEDKKFYSNLKIQMNFGHDNWIYSANLYRVEIVQRPANWMSRDEAWEEFKAKYSGTARKDLSGEENWLESAEKAFDAQRRLMIEGLRAEDFAGQSFRNANLREAFMPGLDLEGADLRGADLSNSYLEEVNLDRAFLQEAGFERTYLRASSLRFAKMRSANLMFADLQNTELSHADLQSVELDLANLYEANLYYANLSGADLHDTDLQNTNLRYAKLANAELPDANLEGALLNRANLENANMVNVNLTEANLGEAKLKETVLHNANLQKVEAIGADFIGAELTGANLNLAILDGANFMNAILNDADFQRTSLVEANLQHAEIWSTDLSRANIAGANLQNATLDGVNLQRALLSRARLQGAVLDGVNLQEAVLDGANLENTYIHESNLSGASLLLVGFGANEYLSQEYINSAFGGIATRLPDDLVYPAHWRQIWDHFVNRETIIAYQDWLWLRPQRKVEWNRAYGYSFVYE